jgi:hypothetical protein
MKAKYRKIRKNGLLLLTLAAMLFSLTAFTPSQPPIAHYRVTIQNLTAGQPFSPAVVATHRAGISMFRVGRAASHELEAIAEDGNQGPMASLLGGLSGVTQVVDVGVPLTPNGTVVGSFTDAVTVDIMARPGERLSIATMLICTNDGFTGLDRARLPRRGARIFWLSGYDAGTEDNTEASGDIVDPCSGLGPFGLAGDPNGNGNDAVDTDPQMRIQHHPGIRGEETFLRPSTFGRTQWRRSRSPG